MSKKRKRRDNRSKEIQKRRKQSNRVVVHPNLPDGCVSSRYKCISRKNPRNRCVICGCCHALDVHHITPQCKGGTDDIWNLMIMCYKHHTEWHHPTSYSETKRKVRVEIKRVEEKYGVEFNPKIVQDSTQPTRHGRGCRCEWCIKEE